MIQNIEPVFYKLAEAAEKLEMIPDIILRIASESKPRIRLAFECPKIAVHMDLQFVDDPKLLELLTSYDVYPYVEGLTYIDSNAVFFADKQGKGPVHWLDPVPGEGKLIYFTNVFSPQPEGVILKPLESLNVYLHQLVVPAEEIRRLKGKNKPTGKLPSQSTGQSKWKIEAEKRALVILEEDKDIKQAAAAQQIADDMNADNWKNDRGGEINPVSVRTDVLTPMGRWNKHPKS